MHFSELLKLYKVLIFRCVTKLDHFTTHVVNSGFLVIRDFLSSWEILELEQCGKKYTNCAL